MGIHTKKANYDTKHARLHAQYEQRKATGICTVCGEPGAIPGKTMCPTCARMHRLKDKEKYDERRRNGQCVWCGKDAGGKSYCQECREKVILRRAKKREETDAAGVCVDCGKPRDGAGRRCEACRKAYNERAKMYRRIREARKRGEAMEHDVQ